MPRRASGWPSWTKRVLAKDGLDFMDALSYHVYWRANMSEPMSPGDPPIITQQVQRYIELMKERGKVKPIYMTEGGIQSPPFASWLPKEGFRNPASRDYTGEITIADIGLPRAAIEDVLKGTAKNGG